MRDGVVLATRHFFEASLDGAPLGVQSGQIDLIVTLLKQVVATKVTIREKVSVWLTKNILNTKPTEDGPKVY